LQTLPRLIAPHFGGGGEVWTSMMRETFKTQPSRAAVP